MKDTKFRTPTGTELPKSRKHLSADSLLTMIRSHFDKVEDPRPGNIRISLGDALMSAFAMFSLKDPSLLAFEQRRKDNEPNLKKVYGMSEVPSDTQMRDILDRVDPELLRTLFKKVFAQLQRGKVLEQMKFLGKYYLASGDGTGYYYSQKKGNDLCLQKKCGENGETAFHQQFYAASLVHPDFREVIPFFPEPIVRQDGQTKNDCERNAARRLMARLRKDHPHLPLVILEDALHANAPHIRDLQAHRLHFIVGVKESDHKHLYKEVLSEQASQRCTDITIDDPVDPRKKHNLFFVNGVPLNKSNPDVIINFLEYWEIHLDDEGNEIKKKEKHFGWITDLEITEENAYEIMRAGRARWKIENETFNTLKNQGYHLEHNYGLGKKYLSQVFLTLTMLAFLVDQTQQLSCGLFRAAWKKAGSKRALWEKIRGLFETMALDSIETMLKLLCFGFNKPEGSSLLDSS